MFNPSEYLIEIENSSPLSNLSGFLYGRDDLVTFSGALEDVFDIDELGDMVFTLLKNADLRKFKLMFNGKSVSLFEGAYKELYSQLFEHRISHDVGPTPSFPDTEVSGWESEDYLEFFSSLRKLCQPVTVNLAPYLKLSKGKKVQSFEGEILLTVMPFDKLARYDLNVYLESFVSNYADSKGTTLDEDQLKVIVNHMISEKYIGMIHFTSDTLLNHVKTTAQNCIKLFEDLRKNCHEL